MSTWEKIVPSHIKVLKFYAIVIIVLSFAELFSESILFVSVSAIPRDFLVFVKVAALFADMGLAFLVLGFIRNNYPNKLPSVKRQYLFLLLLYLTLFSLIVYASYIYQIIMIFLSLEEIIMGVDFSSEIFISVVIIALVVSKLIFLSLLQVGSFKLLKEIRVNFRISSVKTNDLL